MALIILSKHEAISSEHIRKIERSGNFWHITLDDTNGTFIQLYDEKRDTIMKLMGELPKEDL